MLFEVRRAAADIADVLRVAPPAPPAPVDQDALADAEAAYAAHKAALLEAERAASAAHAEEPEAVPAPSPVLVPVPAADAEHRSIAAVYHPDTPLEPDPGPLLASWMTPNQPEPARS